MQKVLDDLYTVQGDVLDKFVGVYSQNFRSNSVFVPEEIFDRDIFAQMVCVEADDVGNGLMTAEQVNVLEVNAIIAATHITAAGVFCKVVNTHRDQSRVIIRIVVDIHIRIVLLDAAGRYLVIIFNGDVLIVQVGYMGVVAVGAGHRTAGYVDNAVVPEDNVGNLGGSGFRADFHALAPVVPNDTIFNQYILEHIVTATVVVDGFIGCLRGVFSHKQVKTLHTNGVVESAQEAVVQVNAHAVVHVDAVRVEAPATDDFHVAYLEVGAANGLHVVNQRVTDGDAYKRKGRPSERGLSSRLTCLLSWSPIQWVEGSRGKEAGNRDGAHSRQ